MSACTCGHPEHAHRILGPAITTERTTTVTDKTPPYVIDLADAQVGDLIEATFRDDPDYLTIRRVKSVEENYVHLLREAHPWPIIRNPHKEFRRFRLLDRPEPPKPALPTEAGTTIRGTDWQRWVDEAKRSDCGVEIDGIYIQTSQRYWAGQSAPKADDGLRERVERLLKDSEAAAVITRPSTWQQGYRDATRDYVRRLRDVLDGSADA